MKMRNSLISFLLIFSYSFGFAHNFVPHCTDVHVAQGHGHGEHHDNHHEHEKGEVIADDHSHIANADHYDDGLIDFLVCALENVNHNDDTCNLDCYTPITEFNNSEKTDETPNLVDDFHFAIIEVDLYSIKSSYSDAVSHRATEGLIHDYSYRGPPTHIS